MDLQAATQLPESFSHTPDSNTGGTRRGHLKLLFWRYALATILDFYANMTVSGGNADPGCRAFRVPMNIRETLLHTVGLAGQCGEGDRKEWLPEPCRQLAAGWGTAAEFAAKSYRGTLRP